MGTFVLCTSKSRHNSNFDCIPKFRKRIQAKSSHLKTFLISFLSKVTLDYIVIMPCFAFLILNVAKSVTRCDSLTTGNCLREEMGRRGPHLALAVIKKRKSKVLMYIQELSWSESRDCIFLHFGKFLTPLTFRPQYDKENPRNQGPMLLAFYFS